MKAVLIVVGKTTYKHFEAGISEYLSRISHYLQFSIEVIPELKATRNLSESEQKEREAALITKVLQPSDHVVLLDEHGSERTSIEFARWMQRKMAMGLRRLVFIIGGPYGFADSIHRLAAEEVSVSKMTFSHQMIRLIFVEQVYRAMTILNNEPYHHE
ncbi:MAG: 23S rRNA (pseudouridine(1915)-N(3))-methyltransferase RlmH [Bacteroidaceae bacterium]